MVVWSLGFRIFCEFQQLFPVFFATQVLVPLYVFFLTGCIVGPKSGMGDEVNAVPGSRSFFPQEE